MRQLEKLFLLPPCYLLFKKHAHEWFSEHLGVIHGPCLAFSYLVIEGEMFVIEFVLYFMKNFFSVFFRFAGSAVHFTQI